MIFFSAKDCAHGCYKVHPYCEPCGKSDYSWNYLIDELKESAGQWLSREAVLAYWSGDKIFQQIGKVIYLSQVLLTLAILYTGIWVPMQYHDQSWFD